jgi:hypothetical protein
MMPADETLASQVSPEVIGVLFGFLRWPPPMIPRFRVTLSRYVRVQVSKEEPLRFTIPTPAAVFGTLFQRAGLPEMEESNSAQYERVFIERASSIQEAGKLLRDQKTKKLFDILSDNGNPNLPGLVFSHPSKRRAIGHFELVKAFGETLPVDTKTYSKSPDFPLPLAAADLLKRNLLERGLLLSCGVCSYKCWYPVDAVGQGFTCGRCYQSQPVSSNPVWLYKLPEVIFQVFGNNVHVPLLWLDHMRRSSRHNFRYLFDSDLSLTGSGRRNIDIACLSDGWAYIGEAKAVDYIEDDQLAFYEKHASQVRLDGLIFATSKQRWCPGTLQAINSIKSRFSGLVIVLTGEQLYQA